MSQVYYYQIGRSAHLSQRLRSLDGELVAVLVEMDRVLSEARAFIRPARAVVCAKMGDDTLIRVTKFAAEVGLTRQRIHQAAQDGYLSAQPVFNRSLLAIPRVELRTFTGERHG